MQDWLAKSAEGCISVAADRIPVSVSVAACIHTTSVYREVSLNTTAPSSQSYPEFKLYGSWVVVWSSWSLLLP